MKYLTIETYVSEDGEVIIKYRESNSYCSDYMHIPTACIQSQIEEFSNAARALERAIQNND